MSVLRFSHVGFSYPSFDEQDSNPVLLDVNFELQEGSFTVLFGDTGSGKTTLLRLAKPELAPVGELRGSIELFGKAASSLLPHESASFVGYVSQNPENQIVCDSVWHELAFGLENLGIDQAEMRLRISETCAYLGIEPLFHAHCAELSGGQQALVCLASILVMRPRLLLLDEPLSMLDPVAQKEFFSLLVRIQKELGITVLLATHNPSALAAYADVFLKLEDGCIRAVSSSDVPSRELKHGNRATEPSFEAPLLTLDDVWFRYGRNDTWVLRGMDLRVHKGEILALVGANGSGKSSVLALSAGSLNPQRGRIKRQSTKSAFLPQNPKAVFANDSVLRELAEWCDDKACVDESLSRLGFSSCPERHPLDLSGGQQQLLAIEKILLTHPDLVMLDEPAKGLDICLREKLAQRMLDLADDGASIVMATHDMAFASAVANTVVLLFDGQAQLQLPTQEFFIRSWVYSSQGRAL